MRAAASIIAILAWVASGFALLGGSWYLSKWLGTMAAARETQRGGGCGGGQRPEQDTSLTHVEQGGS